MENQAEILQHSINTDFLPYGLDMPYRIIVGNNPVNWIDPLGLFVWGGGYRGSIGAIGAVDVAAGGVLYCELF